MLRRLAHIPTHNQPIIRTRLEELQRFAIPPVREMEIGDGPQAGGLGGRRGRGTSRRRRFDGGRDERVHDGCGNGAWEGVKNHQGFAKGRLYAHMGF
jgi:hypothetical protein